MRHREETLNTKLADVLSEMGVQAEAEGILSQGRNRPDVLFDLSGLRVSIEGKLDDVPNASSVVLKQARDRVRVGISHISVAVVYPQVLRSVSTQKLATALRSSALSFAVVSESGESPWGQASPAEILDSLRRSHQQLVSSNTLLEAAKLIQQGVDRVASLWRGNPAICQRLAGALGMVAAETKPDYLARFNETASTVSALVLANALIFQEQISRVNDRVTPISLLFKSPSPSLEIQTLWRMIWQTIDYDPIFRLAESIALEIPTTPDARASLLFLVDKVREVCERQAALHHDLMGRVYHYLLHDAKYLATYYTAPASATLLLKLAMIPERWQLDFGDISNVRQMRIADLACGTGTLLMATSQAIVDHFIRAKVTRGDQVTAEDMAALHQALVEDTLIGLDVLPTAVHLTASTLGLLAPEVQFARMSLYSLPLCVARGKPFLGSLDLLGTPEIAPQLALDGTALEPVRIQANNSQRAALRLPALDICVMNPPFARSAGENLLFGSLPKADRSLLQKELSKRIKGRQANSTAGLGSPFCLLADEHLASGGRLALILPHGVTSGESWGKTRDMIASKYELEFVVSNWSGTSYSFSENTDLSEVMIVCRKLRDDEVPSDTSVFVSLHRPLENTHSALSIAREITSVLKNLTEVDSYSDIRRYDGSQTGVAFRAPRPRLGENWSAALFAQERLYRVYENLSKGNVRILGMKETGSIPLCALGELGTLGPDRRDIHDGFNMKDVHPSDVWTPYAAFLGNDAKTVLTLSQMPNAYLTPLAKPAAGRSLRNADMLQERAGDIAVVERAWPVTQRLLAILLSEPVLSNVWWPLKTELSLKQRQTLVLWLNSSLSLLLFYGRKEVTRGPWVQMKKPAWLSMPVLDVRCLSSDQEDVLARLFTQVSTDTFKPLAQINTDDLRCRIDNTFEEVLGLPNLNPVRQLLTLEPGLTGESIFGAGRIPHEEELCLDGESFAEAAEPSLD